MKKRKVINPKNLPMRSPLIATLVAWLVLDRLDAVGWVWGVVGTVLVIVWFAWLVGLLNDEDVDLLQ